MRKALRISGVSVQEIADYLGVARNTVSTWINGRIKPSRQTMRLWALRCGVPFEWIEKGVLPAFDPKGGGECAARDSNPEPADTSERAARVYELYADRVIELRPTG